nr:hypothetical protein [Bacteroidota bacterium]
CLVSKGQGFVTGSGIYFASDNKLVFVVNNQNTGTGYTFSITTPVYVVGTRIGSTSYTYINGLLFTTKTHANIALTVDNTAGIRLANDPSVRWNACRVFIARAYNRALSQSEITQNYNAMKSRYA